MLHKTVDKRVAFIVVTSSTAEDIFLLFLLYGERRFKNSFGS